MGLQPALDGADRRGRDVAVLRLEGRRVVAHVLQHRPQVLRVEQQQSVVVGDLEDEVEHAFLRVVQVQHPREQQRSHVGHGGAQRMTLRAEHVPERDGAGRELRGVDAEALHPCVELRARPARLRDARQVALHVGRHDRHAEPREAFGEQLQRDGLAGAGGAGDQAVAVGERGQDAGQRRIVGLRGFWNGDGERIEHGRQFLSKAAAVAGRGGTARLA